MSLPVVVFRIECVSCTAQGGGGDSGMSQDVLAALFLFRAALWWAKIIHVYISTYLLLSG